MQTQSGMAKSRFTKEMIVLILKQNENGFPVKEICRREKISEATFYNWKKVLQYEELVLENKRLRAIIEKQEQDSMIEKTKHKKKNKAACQSPLEVNVPEGNEERHLLDLLSSIAAEIIIKEISNESQDSFPHPM